MALSGSVYRVPAMENIAPDKIAGIKILVWLASSDHWPSG
jgi:hypothetical protein